MQTSAKSSKQKLNIADANQTVWLVKVPKALQEFLNSASDGDVLGSLSATTENGKTVRKWVLNSAMQKDAIVAAKGVNEYVVDERQGGLHVVPFLQNEDVGNFSLKGAISKQMTLNPVESNKYSFEMRQRSILAAKRDRVTKSFDASLQVGIPIAREVDFIPPVNRESRRAAEKKSAKRMKLSSEKSEAAKDIKSKMLRAFSTRDKWTLNELKTCCQVTSDSDLKPLLADYATYFSKGPYKNFYELKPEYKVQSSQEKSDS